MAVLLQTTLGELIIDLAIDEVPILAANFLKLCKLKWYNNTIFHSVEKNFVARAGRSVTEEDQSTLSVIKLQSSDDFERLANSKDQFWKAKYFDPDTGYFQEMFHRRLRHSRRGTVSMANEKSGKIGSSFFITLRESIDYLDDKRSVIGYVTEGEDVLQKINETIVEDHLTNKPLNTIRILHTIVLDDPFPDPLGLNPPETSPIVEQDEALEEKESAVESEIAALEKIAQSEAKSRRVALEILGDVPDADLSPPDNVLFICKLNPVTEEEDLEMIFARDWKTGDSLQYGFIEYEDAKSCDAALFKMEGALIDDRRIHVDFCQSVSKQWVDFKRHDPRQSQSNKKGIKPSRNDDVPARNGRDQKKQRRK